jgi:3-dehydroquinate synthase
MEHNLKTVLVDVPGKEYEVQISRDLKAEICSFSSRCTENRDVLIVTDQYLLSGYANALKSSLEEAGKNVLVFVMCGGKASKSFSEVLKIYGILEVNNFARDSVMIALGGGVVGDLAGFVASTWYRGMNLVHVPTTLMAMVDSSIGGKVAINFRDTINAVGNYYHPIANFTDMRFLDTLPDRDFNSGLAEVLKCAFIADQDFANYLSDSCDQILQRELSSLIFCVKRAIEIKVDHIRNDVTERGKRLLLNFGHTLGHAIEMATHSDATGEAFRHGEGVALGMTAAMTLSRSQLGLSSEIVTRVRELIVTYGLPINFSASAYGFDREDLINRCMKLIMKDKKRKDNQLRFVLMDSFGSAVVRSRVPEDQVRAAFEVVIEE